MFFRDIIEQERPKSLLIKHVADERIPHAQLLLGAEGSGSVALAIAFAQYVLCERRTATDSCGSCKSCSKVGKLLHPDVHYSYPTVGTKEVSTNFLKSWQAMVQEQPYFGANQWLQKMGADNKQGNITKDECVSIVRKLSLKPFEATYKILILWLPEYLGKEGNRLLKLIEEPPANTLFLLVAENQELILNTILSRCQLVRLDPLTDAGIAAALQEREGVAPELALQIARLSDGNYVSALALKENIQSDNAAELVVWLRACYKGNGEELVGWVEQFARKGREPQKQFLRYGLHFLRELLFLKAVGDGAALRLQGEELKNAVNLAKILSLEHIEQLHLLFNELIGHLERYANPKILMLPASIKMHHLIRKPQPSWGGV